MLTVTACEFLLMRRAQNLEIANFAEPNRLLLGSYITRLRYQWEALRLSGCDQYCL